jgi:hypothetical protein
VIRLLAPIIAILSLTVIECFALHNGIDGTVLILVVGAVAGLGGFELERLIRYFRRTRPPDR